MPARTLIRTPFLRLALLLAAGPVSPAALGVAFVLAQALVVLGFAVMQWSALRRAEAGATPVCALT